MKREQDVALSQLTTFKTGGTARARIVCESVADLKEAVAYAGQQGLPFYVLGSGSNVLASDTGYEGVLIHPAISGITFKEENDRVLCTAGSGVLWDDLVRAVAEKGLWGIENLAGIPGTVGAAPVQNIGAYGTELSSTVVSVHAYDPKQDIEVAFSNAECEFGYRDSRFKRLHDVIITAVTFALNGKGKPNASYTDLLRAQEEGVRFDTPEAMGNVVRSIRSKKFPDLTVHGTAGSFFKNPVITEEAYQKLAAQYPELPHFSTAHGVKVPLAFVLDKILNLRGFRMNHAWLYTAQPLVLVCDVGGTTNEIETLAHTVEEKILEATNITVEREVRSLA